MNKLIIFLALAFNIYSALAYSRYELYCDSELLRLARDSAIAQVGVLEDKGHNRGAINKYYEPFRAKPGAPYCAAGIYWCFWINAVNCKIDLDSIPIPRTMLANSIYTYAKNYGVITEYKARQSDLIVWRKRSGSGGHIEFIIERGEKGWVKTVGFNTSGKVGNKRVEGVFIKKRNIFSPLESMRIRGLVGFNRR
jgi:hypothetical protein